MVSGQHPESLGAILDRWFSGQVYIGLCRACWCRQDVSDGVRCRACGGLVARVRVV